MQNKETEFLIPKNVSSRFELIQNIGLKEMLFFVPSLIIDAGFAMFVPLPLPSRFIIPAKIVFSGFMLFIPFALVYIRPIRDNVPVWKMIVWKYKFKKRQKTFEFRKKVELLVWNKK